MPFTEPDREVLANAYAAIEGSAGLLQSSSASDARARLRAALVRTSRNVSALLQNAAVNTLDAAELPAVAQAAVVEAAQVLTALRGLTNYAVLGPLGANPTAARLPAMVADRATSNESTEVEELGSPETNMLVDQFALPMMHYATVMPGASPPDDELVGRALDTIGAGAALAAAASHPPKFASERDG